MIGDDIRRSYEVNGFSQVKRTLKDYGHTRIEPGSRNNITLDFGALNKCSQDTSKISDKSTSRLNHYKHQKSVDSAKIIQQGRRYRNNSINKQARKIIMSNYNQEDTENIYFPPNK